MLFHCSGLHKKRTTLDAVLRMFNELVGLDRYLLKELNCISRESVALKKIRGEMLRVGLKEKVLQM